MTKLRHWVLPPSRSSTSSFILADGLKTWTYPIEVASGSNESEDGRCTLGCTVQSPSVMIRTRSLTSFH